MISRKYRQDPRGITSVAVLVCLVMVVMISGALLKIGLAHRDEVRTQERRLQAEWLAQAGVERALARLAEHADYTGETWAISTSDMGLPTAPDKESGPAAVVRIHVEPDPSARERRRLIKVQADYPPEPPRRARHSLQLSIDLGASKTGASQ